MSSDVPDVELLFSPPPEQSDVEMVPETGSPEPPRSPSAQASSEHLSRLTSLSLADNPPSVYVEVATLPAEKKAKYATLAERPITSDEEFPEEAMERVLGEYKSSDGEFYFVRMSSGVAFKVSRTLLPRGIVLNAMHTVPGGEVQEKAPGARGAVQYVNFQYSLECT